MKAKCLSNNFCFSNFQIIGSWNHCYDHIFKCLEADFPFPLMKFLEKVIFFMTGFWGLVTLVARKWIEHPQSQKVMQLYLSSYEIPWSLLELSPIRRNLSDKTWFFLLILRLIQIFHCKKKYWFWFFIAKRSIDSDFSLQKEICSFGIFHGYRVYLIMYGNLGVRFSYLSKKVLGNRTSHYSITISFSYCKILILDLIAFVLHIWYQSFVVSEILWKRKDWSFYYLRYHEYFCHMFTAC